MIVAVNAYFLTVSFCRGGCFEPCEKPLAAASAPHGPCRGRPAALISIFDFKSVKGIARFGHGALAVGVEIGPSQRLRRESSVLRGAWPTRYAIGGAFRQCADPDEIRLVRIGGQVIAGREGPMLFEVTT